MKTKRLILEDLDELDELLDSVDVEVAPDMENEFWSKYNQLRHNIRYRVENLFKEEAKHIFRKIYLFLRYDLYAPLRYKSCREFFLQSLKKGDD